jgi:hypothetical protein
MNPRLFPCSKPKPTIAIKLRKTTAISTQTLEAQPEYRADEKGGHGERHNDHLSEPRKISMPMKTPARAAKRRAINTVATAQFSIFGIRNLSALASENLDRSGAQLD